jgi:hypothetical protein
MGICCKFPGGTITSHYRPNESFVDGKFNVSSLLNGEYSLINVLKALAAIVSMCSLHVTLLSELHRDILHYLQMQYFFHFNVGWDTGGRRLRE